IFLDGAAEITTEIVLFLIVLGSDTGVCQGSVRVKHWILVVFKQRPVEIVGSRLVAEIGDAAAGFSVFGGVVRRLYLEFADGISARAEFIQAAAAQVVTADRDAID